MTRGGPRAARSALLALAALLLGASPAAGLPVPLGGDPASSTMGMPPAALGAPPVALTPSVGMPLPAVGTPSALGDPAATLTLTGIRPTIAGPGLPVVVSGTVSLAAGATAPPRTLVVRAVRGRATPTTRADVETWSAALGPATGTELARVTIPAATGPIPFSLTLPDDAIRLTRASGAVPVAVEVQGPGGTSLAVTRTFVGWQRTGEDAPISLAFLVPLTLDPDPALVSTVPATRLAAWRAAIGPDSRLDRVLRATADLPVAYAVDPALLAWGAPRRTPAGGPAPTPQGTPGSTPGSAIPPTPSAGAPGPSALPAPTPSTSVSAPVSSTGAPAEGSTGGAGGTGSTAPATVESLRADLGRRLAALSAAHEMLALPTSDPELDGLLAAATEGATADPTDPTAALGGTPADAAALLADLVARDRVLTAHGIAVTGRLAWPVGDALDADEEQALRTAYGGGEVTLLHTGTGAPRGAPTPPARGTSVLGRPVLRADDLLGELFAQGGAAASAVPAVAHLLADTVTLRAEAPTTARAFLVVAPRAVDLDPAALGGFMRELATTPWLRTATVASLTAGAGEPSGSRPGGAGAGAAGGERDRMSALAATARTVGAYAGALPVDSPAVTRWDELVTFLAGVRWRQQPPNALADELAGATSRADAGLSISPQTTNFLADEGILQVTVVNELDEPVSGVRVRLQPGNARIRVVDEAPPVTIGARSRAIVPVRVAAVAQGLVPVTAWLTTADGERIGTGAELSIRAAPPGAWPYVVLGALAALVLVVGTVRTLRRPRRSPVPDLDPITPSPEPPLEEAVEHRPDPPAADPGQPRPGP